VVEKDLALSKEVLADKYKDRLEESYKVSSKRGKTASLIIERLPFMLSL
jgi:hypothetical protein